MPSRTAADALDGQAPHAVVLACSDSRVIPDLIFSQGLGDLFVVRVAGNYPDDLVLGSIEFAIAELARGWSWFSVTRECGAVKAVYDALATSSRCPGTCRRSNGFGPRDCARACKPGRARTKPFARTCAPPLRNCARRRRCWRRGHERPHPGRRRGVPARERCGYAGRLSEETPRMRVRAGEERPVRRFAVNRRRAVGLRFGLALLLAAPFASVARPGRKRRRLSSRPSTPETASRSTFDCVQRRRADGALDRDVSSSEPMRSPIQWDARTPGAPLTWTLGLAEGVGAGSSTGKRSPWPFALAYPAATRRRRSDRGPAARL